MIFERKKYLDELIAGRGNGLVKIITGVRRCGKSFLLFDIWHNWLLEHGVTDNHIIEIQLLRAKERGDLIKLRHGIYAVPDVLLNTMIDVERIVPNGIVCLYNAWAYHQLSTTVPPAFCIAIANKRKVVIPDTLPIELYYWKKENLEFGIMNAEISGYHVRITDMERSVCDAMKYRNKLGLDVCAEEIRSYLRKPNRNLTRLQDYAKRLRVFNTLKNYLEIAIK